MTHSKPKSARTTRGNPATDSGLARLMARPTVVCVLLAVLTLSVFWPVMHNDFVSLDDPDYVLNNRQLQTGFSMESVRWAFQAGYASNWHPLTWLSHMLDYQIYGLRPGGHHLTNLLLHLGNVLLVFLVLRRLTGALWRSACVTALFAIHPLHVESVAWISERKDVLSVFFGLLALGAYTRYAQTSEVRSQKSEVSVPPSALRPLHLTPNHNLSPALRPLTSSSYWLAVVFFALALMSKPMLVTLPFVLLLLDYWPLKRLQSSTLLRLAGEKLPFFLLSCGSSVLTVAAQNRGGAVSSLDVLPLSVRFTNAVASYFRYIQKMLWPTDLSVFYPYPKSLSVGLLIGGGLALVAATLVILRLGRHRSYFTMGWFWYLGTLVPVIGLVQVGGHAFADRYTYLPLLGLFVILVWGAVDFMSRWRWTRFTVIPAALAGFLCCAALSRAQIACWRSSRALYEHAIAVTTDNALAHVNLGDTFLHEGNLDAAVQHSREALRINPNLSQAHGNLGLALRRLGRTAVGLEHLRDAVRLKPDSAAAQNNLGLALAVDGNPEAALPHYREALRLDPEHPDAGLNLGAALNALGRYDEAVAQFQSVLTFNPNDVEAHFNLGVVLTSLGRYDEAQSHLIAVLKKNPRDADAHYRLGEVYAGQKKSREALAEYQTALQLSPNHTAARARLELYPAPQPGRD